MTDESLDLLFDGDWHKMSSGGYPLSVVAASAVGRLGVETRVRHEAFLSIEFLEEPWLWLCQQGWGSFPPDATHKYHRLNKRAKVGEEADLSVAEALEMICSGQTQLGINPLAVEWAFKVCVLRFPHAFHPSVAEIIADALTQRTACEQMLSEEKTSIEKFAAAQSAEAQRKIDEFAGRFQLFHERALGHEAESQQLRTTAFYLARGIALGRTKGYCIPLPPTEDSFDISKLQKMSRQELRSLIYKRTGVRPSVTLGKNALLAMLVTTPKSPEN